MVDYIVVHRDKTELYISMRCGDKKECKKRHIIQRLCALTLLKEFLSLLSNIPYGCDLPSSRDYYGDSSTDLLENSQGGFELFSHSTTSFLELYVPGIKLVALFRLASN